jgi:hypothetical protein
MRIDARCSRRISQTNIKDDRRMTKKIIIVIIVIVINYT